MRFSPLRPSDKQIQLERSLNEAKSTEQLSGGNLEAACGHKVEGSRLDSSIFPPSPRPRPFGALSCPWLEFDHLFWCKASFEFPDGRKNGCIWSSDVLRKICQLLLGGGGVQRYLIWLFISTNRCPHLFIFIFIFFTFSASSHRNPLSVLALSSLCLGT